MRLTALLILLLAALPGPARASESRYPYPGLDTQQKRLELAEKERGEQCSDDSLKKMFSRGFDEAASGTAYLPALGMVVLPELEALGRPGQGREACGGLKDAERDCCHRGFAAGQKQLVDQVLNSKKPGLDGSICAAFIVAGSGKGQNYCRQMSQPMRSGVGESASCRSLGEGERKKVRDDVAQKEWRELWGKALGAMAGMFAAWADSIRGGAADFFSGKRADKKSAPSTDAWEFFAAAKAVAKEFGEAMKRGSTDPSAYEHLCGMLEDPSFTSQITCYSAGFERSAAACREYLEAQRPRPPVAVSAAELSDRRASDKSVPAGRTSAGPRLDSQTSGSAKK